MAATTTLTLKNINKKRKADATILAELVYDIYKEQKAGVKIKNR